MTTNTRESRVKELAARSKARHQRDAAVCLSRHCVGDRDDCLSDASTARASRAGLTIDPDPGR